jgi:aminopeptidase N
MRNSIKGLFLLIFLYSCTGGKMVHETLDEVSVAGEKNKGIGNYRAAYTAYADLIHTKLLISPDWKNKQLHGVAYIDLKMHYHPSDSVILNARGMIINEVGLFINNELRPLEFTYDSMLINIRLDKTYTKADTFCIFISYVSQPEKVKVGGSRAITKDKGLYFIDADSIDPTRPTQLWTQGETESNSVWFPTIESPSQKMTQEIYITVDSSFVTLSNGLLISSVKNSDGTRTDYWKQNLPHAPYLAMIAVGNWIEIKDSWKEKVVSYYVDPEYEKYVNQTFGHTPEILTFFSTLLDYDYPWDKYAQVPVHEYVSGAMENTTVVVHGSRIQQDPGEYADHSYENYISHEAIHHWFGDLLTCESWSNMALNEGFANYGEYLWREYKFGRQNADEHLQAMHSRYFRTAEKNDPPAVNYEYVHREDMYNAITYNKAGSVLHMLRKYTGDQAFFDALRYYVKAHAFSAVELADLRMAFEKITGEDLNWFFNQWYLHSSYPRLTVKYSWNDSLRLQTITVSQISDSAGFLFQLPIDFDFYLSDGTVMRRREIIDKALNVFNFPFDARPSLVCADAESMLLGKVTEIKSNEEFVFQYHNSSLFEKRFQAIKKLGENYIAGSKEAGTILTALKDKSPGIRLLAISISGEIAKNDTASIKPMLINIVKNDSSAAVKTAALYALNTYFSFAEMLPVYYVALADISYNVKAFTFNIIADKDQVAAEKLAGILEKDSGTAVISALTEFYSLNVQSDKTSYFQKALFHSKGWDRYDVIKDFEKYLSRNHDSKIIYTGVSLLSERAQHTISASIRQACIKSLENIEIAISLRNAGDKPGYYTGLDYAADMQSLSDKIRIKISALK